MPHNLNSLKKVKAINLISAKNDLEAFQVFVTGKNKTRKIEFKNSILKCENSPENQIAVSLNLIEDVCHEGLFIPDILGENKAFSLEPDENRIIWGTVEIPENAQSGDYFGTLEFSVDGEFVKLPLNLKVYPFALPEMPSFKFTCGLPRGRKYSKTTYDVWCRQLGKHRISARNIYSKPKLSFDGNKPVIDSSEFKKDLDFLVNECHMNFFQAPYSYVVGGHEEKFYQTFGPFKKGHTSKEFKIKYLATMTDVATFMRKNNSLDYFLSIIWDEPYFEHIPQIKEVAELVNKAGLRASMFGLAFAGHVPLQGYIKDYISVASQTSSPFVRRFHERGERLYGYNPARAFKITKNPARSRRLIWWAGFTKIDGLLQWCVSPTAKRVRYEDLGHSWVYENPERVFPNEDKKGFLSSVRFEMLREGLEDFEYLKMYDEICQTKALEMTKKPLGFSPSMVLMGNFTDNGKFLSESIDGNKFNIVRSKLIKEIDWMKKTPSSIFFTSFNKVAETTTVNVFLPKGVKIFINGEKADATSGFYKKELRLTANGLFIKAVNNTGENEIHLTKSEAEITISN
jgi:glycosyl hydrolase family 123